MGACWRMPELAHTQTHLSNTFAEVCKYDSDHAADALPAAAIPGEGGGLVHEAVVRDRPVFGEVRLVRVRDRVRVRARARARVIG